GTSRNHALNTPRNHLAYLNRLPTHDSIDDMAARHNDLRHHISNLQ
ncbi:hypothetical protein A2U01_0101323, partial [Trifolium medium]|nr:hypothetical protein [Trifolium medium]